MSDAVIVGLIAAVSSILCQAAISHSKSRETDAKMAAHEQKQEDGLEEVKKELQGVKVRLDKHNGYAEKFSQAKESIVELSTNQKNIQKDVDSIKKTVEFLKTDRCKL